MLSKVPRRVPASFIAFILLCASGVAEAQVALSAVSELPTAQQVIQRNTDSYAGSVPQGQATDQVIELTAEDALDRGLKYNLGLFLSERVSDQAKAARYRALSGILPHVNGAITEEVQRVNLAAFGFKFPGFPSSVGPFGIFDMRATGEWAALDLSAIDSYRASNENIKAAKFSVKDARDTVVIAVGANYLLTVADESRVAAAEAQVRTAQALYQLAVDQENAGLAPNIDTLRARVQLQAQQNELIQAQNQLEKQRIALARVIGLPVQQKFRIVNRVPYSPFPDLELNNLYQRALSTRADYQAALANLRAAELNYSAAWKERLPSIVGSGEYGVLGYTPSTLAPNYSGAVSLRVPIFQGGRVRADITQTQSALKERQARVDNMRAQIEQEIQDSLLDLKAAAQAVDVAKTGLDLAQQALAQSQDRFAAGVTNNVEVIQAQQQLATANDQYIASLYAHSIAKVLLARAMGNAEQSIKQYLAQPGNVNPAVPNGNAPQAPTTVNPNPGPTAGLDGAILNGQSATASMVPTSNVERQLAPEPPAKPENGAGQASSSSYSSSNEQVRR